MGSPQANRAERRREVRMRPIPELPARASLVDEGGVELEQLEVSDVSMGGIALATSGKLRTATVGTQFELKLELGRYGVHVVRIEVRHGTGNDAGVTGLQYVRVTDDSRRMLGRYIAELLERGAPS